MNRMSRPFRVVSLMLIACGDCFYQNSSGGQCVRYDMQLTSAGPGCPTSPRAMNDVGDIVGVYSCGAGYDRGWVAWNGMPNLEPLDFGSGVVESFASGINSNRYIVGSRDAGAGLHAYRLHEGQVLDLGTLGGALSSASAISDAGIIVGESGITGGVANHAFQWDGVMTDLNLPIGPNNSAWDVNEAGAICGWMGSSAINRTGFIWNNGDVVNLGPIPGGVSSNAVAINNKIQVCGAGVVRNPNGGSPLTHAFFWENGVMTDIGVLPGYTRSAGRDISDQSIVVGICTGGSGVFNHGFVWRDGVMRDLNELISRNLSLEIRAANAINFSGQIACEAYDSSTGEIVAALLTPLPPQPGDVNCDRLVNMDDLLAVISAWGPDAPQATFGSGTPDLNADRAVNIDDLLVIVNNWTS